MKALAIIAMIFSIVSMVVPGFGAWLAAGSSIVAMITFRREPTFSGVAFGINIISTAFLSPVLLSTIEKDPSIYFSWVGLHVVLFVIAIVYKIIRGKKTPIT